jgi:capsular exopolysaccharide synthesis family protein
MKPRDLVAAIRKRGWLIIVIVLLAALFSAVIARVQTPSYKVEILVSAVAPKNPTNNQPDASIASIYALALMPSIASATESIDVAEATSERLRQNGIDVPAESLLSKVKAEADVNSAFATITVTDDSPTRVADIANTWGEVLEIQTSDNPEVNNPDLKEVLLGGKLVVTNRAVPPAKANQPKPLVYLGLGFFVGLVLGFGLVIGIEYFDPHFRSTQEVEESLDIKVLGIIPKLKGADATTLLATRADNSPVHEAYSQLRTTLMFSLAEKPFKSVVVASAIPTEDGPYIPANLAVSIAYIDRKTLLIDCDVRDKAISKLMGAADKPGLADSLALGEPVSPKITATKIPNLYLLPAGRTSEESSDLLSLPLMDEYLRELEDQYDKLVIYAPALITAIDAVVAASKANLSLVVLDAQKCSRNIVLSAMESFNLLHLKPTGVVLSNVKLSRRERAIHARKAAPASREYKKGVSAGGAAQPLKAKELAPRQSTASQEKVGALEAPIKPEREPERSKGRPPKPAKTKAKKAAFKKSDKGSKAKATSEMPGPSMGAIPRKDKTPYPAVTPVSPAARSTEEELRQMKEIVADDFRRLGATGAPIPKQWLRALNADKPDVRESAKIAISAYYESFLHRYSISEESIKSLTESIIKMMRREGEFAHMSEEEAQKYLQKMLMDAGARFSTSLSVSGSPANAERAGDISSGKEREAEKEEGLEEEVVAKYEAEDAHTGEEQETARTSQPLETQPQPQDNGDIDWE